MKNIGNTPILLLTGPIRTGKTTALRRWSAGLTSVGGILTPDIDGRRRLLELATGEIHPFQAPDDAGHLPPDVVPVGRFRFYRSALERARDILRRDLAAAPDWLVVDEVGKLELQGQGLQPVVSELIAHYLSPAPRGRLLLVVRDTLLAEVAGRFGLATARVIGTAALLT